MKKITIHDIARQAQVSIATVSRVLNKSHGVSPQTVTKVRRVISENGYFPDNSARGMRHSKSYAIGYIVSDISNNHFTVAAKFLEQTLAEEGYSLIVCSTGGDKKKEKDHLHFMMSKKIDGLVINVSGHNDDLVVKLSRQVPVVLIARKINNEAFQGDFVGNDGFQGAYELGRHMLSMGHRRIGLIRGPSTISTGHERYSGFMAAVQEQGLTLEESLIYPGDYYRESGWSGTQQLLALPVPPTAVVVLNPTMALGALAYIKQSGLSIPGDVSFAAYGNIANHELLYVNPTTIREHPEHEGKLAGERLLLRIAGKDTAPVKALTPSQLLAGNSVRMIG